MLRHVALIKVATEGREQSLATLTAALEEALHRHLKHPGHQELVAEVLTPVARSVATAQFQV